MAALIYRCRDCKAPCAGVRCKACYKANVERRQKPCAACGRLCYGQMCADCRRETPLIVEPGPCQVCRAAMEMHARCRTCDILAGPGHYVPALLPSGQCPSCAAWDTKRARWAA